MQNNLNGDGSKFKEILIVAPLPLTLHEKYPHFLA